MASNRRGKAKLSSYGVWADMLQRCSNKNLKNYPGYGGRGIKVCEDWKNFDNFYRDMGDKPKNLSLDRIDNSGDYCLENCKWSTLSEQSFNTRRTHFLAFNGEVKPLTQWARDLGMNPVSLSFRIHNNWSVEKALTTKVRSRSNRKGR